MKVLSLFAGVGGFDLAAERCGMTVVAHCEIDKAARKVLARRFPDALTYDDVRTLDPDDLRRAGAVPDLICGGFPCQDLSVAGRRAGLAGARSGLFFEIVRLAADLQPRWLVLENVPGLLSSHDGRDMGAVLGALGELGYGWAYRVLDAQHFGVPQRRRRVFIVGCLGDRAAPVQVLLEPEGSDGDPATGEQAGTAVAALTRCGLGGGGPDDNLAQTGHLLAAALTAREGKGPDSDATTTLLAHTLTGEGHDASEDGTGRGTPLVPMTFRKAQKAHDLDDCERWQADDCTDTLDAGGHAARTAHVVVAPTITASWGSNNGAPGDGGKDQAVLAFHMTQDPISGAVVPAMGAKSIGNGVLTQLAVRRLTPTECERLQGFPDGWTDGQADSARYRQMGNAVAVPVVEWVFRRLLAVAAKEAAA